MSAKARRQGSSPAKRTYIAFAAITLAVLAVVFAVIMQLRSKTPVYVLQVNGLDAETPAEAQIECRAEHGKFAKPQQEYTGCSWVWCGDSKLYLVKTTALRIDTKDETANFTAVTFDGGEGKRLAGFVIDPAIQPKELGRIVLEGGEKCNFESVSMSIREGLRSGEISYEDAVYLWDKDSTEVIAVRADSYQTVQDNIVSFTDDGNVTHTCYILDTKID